MRGDDIAVTMYDDGESYDIEDFQLSITFEVVDFVLDFVGFPEYPWYPDDE